MRFRLTLPQNEAFFQRYAGLIPTLSKLGYLAQVVSALTEIGILFALIRGAIADIAPPMVATVAGILGAALGTAFIEVGLRKFLPFTARQILNKRFAGLDLVMSIAIFAASALLLTASGYLSFKGSKDTVETVTPPAKKGEVVTGLYDDLKEGERQTFSTDSAAIGARYAAQIAALDLAHQAATDAAKTKLKGIEGKERNTGQSYATQKASIKQAIADAAAGHAAKLADIHSQQAVELKARQDKRDAEIKIVNDRLNRAYKTEERQFVEAEAKRAQQVKVWGGSVAWFTVVCLAVLLLSIALQEVHAHGAQVQEEAIPTEFYFRESPTAAFINAVSERFHVWAFSVIKRIEDGTPEPPEPPKPPTVYEYTQTMTRRPIGFKPIPLHRKPEDTHVGDGSSAKEALQNLTRPVAYETRIDAHKLKDCLHCGAKFMPNHKVQKYCSEGCRVQAWEQRNGRKPYMKKGSK